MVSKSTLNLIQIAVLLRASMWLLIHWVLYLSIH